MAAVTEGMNVGEIEQLGQQLKTASARVANLVQQLDSLVRNAAWLGPDAQAFTGTQWPSHRARLSIVAQDLQGFGQSALNNAAEQRGVSDTLAVVGGAAAVAGVGLIHSGNGTTPPTPTANPSQLGGSQGMLAPSKDSPNQTSGYQAAGMGYYGPNGESAYQCTAWANYRWKELGYGGPAVSGNGWQMASIAGHTSSTPTLGALASTTEGHNHVMVVEGVSAGADGRTHITISEGNGLGIQGLTGTPAEWGSRGELVQQSGGAWQWVSRNGKPVSYSEGDLTFAGFRSS